VVIISREQVLNKLRSLGVMPALLQSVYSGWSRYQKNVASAFKTPTPRLRANAVHDLVAEELETRTRKIPGARFTRDGDRSWLHLGGDLVIEIHKLTEELVAHRNQTSFAEILDAQQLSLPGFGPVLVLTLGYTHDRLGADLRQVLLVCSCNNRLVWDIDLQAEASATIKMVPSDTRKSGTRKDRVKAKPGVKTTKQDKENPQGES